MKNTNKTILDANEAVASTAFRINETVAIYPITPSSTMAEFCDEWAAKGLKNIWGVIPDVVEMQSEGGAAGAMHGALQAGTLTTTFTASQGLLLMIPNMYKIAGELTPMCMHVSARTLAAHALSIFGDHSDVMACRQTGFALLPSNSAQEAHDMACIGQAASLHSRIPVLHYFDGFRTSHEVNTFVMLTDEQLAAMIPDELVAAHRARALSPDRPFIRGTAQNPDAFMQAREAINPFYNKAPEIFKKVMDQFAQVTGRAYHLFDYAGAADADTVVVVMGSAAETVEQTVLWLNQNGRKTGVVKVRLYRPFSVPDFIAAMPKSVKTVAVLDRTKEPGAVGEPLYQDVITAIAEARAEDSVSTGFNPRVIGGRYGLSSKEFTPACVKAVFDNAAPANKTPKNHFTVGIVDDVTHTSLPVEAKFDLESDKVFRGVFIGLGSDGTVGANKNSVKIIGDETDNYAQAYFVYDSKKSGAMTVSHLRFGPEPIHAPYLIQNARFVGCHQFQFLEKYDVLKYAAPNAVFLLNSIYSADDVWNHIPREIQEGILGKKLKFYVIDAYRVARETKMGVRINTIMQTCFFAISGILPREEAIQKIKDSIKKTYGKKGENIVQQNYAAVDQTLANLHEVKYPNQVTATFSRPPIVPAEAPEFVQKVSAKMIQFEGDSLPVSAMPVDGTWPSATTQWEKLNSAQEVPIWDPAVCIQCNKCAMVCPHAAVRAKYFTPEQEKGAPEGWRSVDYRSRDLKGCKFTIQEAPEDCTGCGLCIAVCPAKDKKNPKHKALNMEPLVSVRERERAKYKFFLDIPDPDRTKLEDNVKGAQFKRPLFEYSGACPGCGETPYVKLLTQLFGDRLMIGNATGCSSIYGGNLPTTPYCVDANGRGPAWSNSLFEDNAEFAFGMRLAVDKQAQIASMLLQELAPQVGDALVKDILSSDQRNEAGIFAQRERVQALRDKLKSTKSTKAILLSSLADYLVKKSVWALGGDGWAYDIGYGGLDHVLASGRKINILVLDTEVYSNTGGQQSKSTPMGAVAKFAAAGKAAFKKDLGLLAIGYGTIYVATVAMGAKDNQTVQAFLEADSYDGPSLIIAYSHCIAHGYNLLYGLDQQKKAVDCGYWPLYRFDPRRVKPGESGLKLDSGEPKLPLKDYIDSEGRYKMLQIADPERATALAATAQEWVKARYARYEKLAGKNGDKPETTETSA